MEQTDRITEMERILQEAKTVLQELRTAYENYRDIEEDIRRLEDYYESEEWRKDFEDDEAGLLPSDLNRGVLSEDEIYDLLEDERDLIGEIGDLYIDP